MDVSWTVLYFCRANQSLSTLIYQTTPSCYKQQFSSQYNPTPSSQYNPTPIKTENSVPDPKSHAACSTKPNIYDVPYSRATKYSPVSCSEEGGSRTNSLQISYNASNSSRPSRPPSRFQVDRRNKQLNMKQYPNL